MFYIGDDSISKLNLINDVLELTKNSVNTSANRIIILYDGPDVGDSKLEILDSPFGLNSRKIDFKSTNIPTINSNEIDMSSSNTLTQFIKYSKSKSPTKYYGLFFGSHGTGYTQQTKSGLQLEKGQNTMFHITDIARSLEANNGVNLVTFDVCLQGNIETIYEMKDSTDYIVASPELVAVPGNNYTDLIVSIFSSSLLTPFELGKLTIESYYDHYSAIGLIMVEDSIDKSNAKDLMQLYNTKELVKIIDKIDFTTLPKTPNTGTFTADPSLNISNFNSNQYINIFGAIETDIDGIYSSNPDIITKPFNGLYKYISIYSPGSGNYNSAYAETKFAKAHPNWVTRINPPAP